MTVDTINKANDLHREIIEVITIIDHLKNRTTNNSCTIYMMNDRTAKNAFTLNDETILNNMCGLLINEYRQKLNRLQQELDKL